MSKSKSKVSIDEKRKGILSVRIDLYSSENNYIKPPQKMKKYLGSIIPVRDNLWAHGNLNTIYR